MSKGKVRNGRIAAIDVGTSKVCCFIARVDGDALRVTGIGHQISHGLRAGAVIDMASAEQSILAAVHAAEQMAGDTIRDAIAAYARDVRERRFPTEEHSFTMDETALAELATAESEQTRSRTPRQAR